MRMQRYSVTWKVVLHYMYFVFGMCISLVSILSVKDEKLIDLIRDSKCAVVISLHRGLRLTNAIVNQIRKLLSVVATNLYLTKLKLYIWLEYYVDREVWHA